MKKSTIPAIVKKIKSFKPIEINFGIQKSISYSQLSMYLSCPKKWALQYKEGQKIPSFSINMTFGTAIHETIQNYLTVAYEKSGVEADNIDLILYFETKFQEAYLKAFKQNKNMYFSSADEMAEFYEDAIAILEFVKKNRSSYFGKRGWYLVGVEIPIVMSPDKRYKNVFFNGFIDLVLYHEDSEQFVIYDLKSSTRGWGNKEKKDETKQFQILLYKHFFSEQFNVPIENIDVKFFILKRKIWEECDFPMKRIQEFTPSNGKTKVNRAKIALANFVDDVMNIDGTFKDKKFIATPSKDACLYCPYKNKKELCDKAILK